MDVMTWISVENLVHIPNNKTRINLKRVELLVGWWAGVGGGMERGERHRTKKSSAMMRD
jgi:hypothetical protein